MRTTGSLHSNELPPTEAASFQDERLESEPPPAESTIGRPLSLGEPAGEHHHLLDSESELDMRHLSFQEHETRPGASTPEPQQPSAIAVPLALSRYSDDQNDLFNTNPESNAHIKPPLEAKNRPFLAMHGTPRSSTVGVWCQELILSLYTIGLFVAITAVLSRFSGQPQPSWMLGLNLNTVIALLATFLRSALVMVVEQVLSQAKWTWHERSRPISDLARFDEASRGPWGSLLLWFKVAMPNSTFFLSRHTVSAIVATIVTILSLAIGSFTQQSVRAVTCTVAIPGRNASLPIANDGVSHLYFRYGAATYDLDVSAKARVFNAMSGASYDRSMLIRGCSTGNCTFTETAPGRTLATSGICSKCTDTTSVIREVPLNGTSVLRLPNESEVKPPLSLINTNISHHDWSVSLPNVTHELRGIWNVSVLAVDVLSMTVAGCEHDADNRTWDCFHPPFGFDSPGTTSGDWNAVSAHCVLYPCIQDIEATIVNGRLEETVINETPFNNSIKWNDYAVHTYRYPCYIDGDRYDEHNISLAPGIDDQSVNYDFPEKTPEQCSYHVSFNLQRAIKDSGGWIQDLMAGSCSMAVNSGDGRLPRGWPICWKKWWLAELYNGGNATFESISSVMRNVATAFTDSYRLDSWTESGLNLNNTVNGTVWETTVCTEFNWPWLVFPASMVILTILSLTLMMASTASSTNRPPVWKSSILPLLYLRDTPAESEPEGYRIKELEKTAKSEIVKIAQDETLRWRFVRSDRTW